MTTAATDKPARRREHRVPREGGRRPASGVQSESLKEQAQDAHEEARMVLPGIQALFGFQLIAVFNEPFFDLDPGDRTLHLASLVLVALSSGLIMAPASYRRLAEETRISRRWVRFASRCIASAMAALMIAIALDVYLVAMMVVRVTTIAVAVALGTAAFLGGLWFVLPFLRKSRQRPVAG